MRARTAAFVLSALLVGYLGLCSWEGALALYDGFTGGGAAPGLRGASRSSGERSGVSEGAERLGRDGG